MTRSRVEDPYLAVLRRFNRFGVQYVVVGMAGINYYAKNPSEMFASLDFDLFINPTLRNVHQALRALSQLSVTVGTADGMLDPRDLKRVVRDQRTLVASTSDGLLIELLLKISGYPFAELANDAATFVVSGVPVKVGRLQKLLRSKRLANRPKDRRFLQRYRDLLE